MTTAEINTLYQRRWELARKFPNVEHAERQEYARILAILKSVEMARQEDAGEKPSD